MQRCIESIIVVLNFLDRVSTQGRWGIYINFRERLKLLDSIREIIISLIHRVYIFAPLRQKFFVRHFQEKNRKLSPLILLKINFLGYSKVKLQP